MFFFCWSILLGLKKKNARTFLKHVPDQSRNFQTMNFFQNLTSQITKIAEEVADAVIETVNEIANAEDLYETRNTPARTSKKEDLNEDWTLLEGDIENADDFKERVVRLPDKHDEYHGVWTAQIENFDGVWGISFFLSIFLR